MVKKTVDGTHVSHGKARHGVRNGLKCSKVKAGRPGTETSFVIEPLEPRILFSADLAPLAPNPNLDGSV